MLSLSNDSAIQHSRVAASIPDIHSTFYSYFSMLFTGPGRLSVTALSLNPPTQSFTVSTPARYKKPSSPRVSSSHRTVHSPSCLLFPFPLFLLLFLCPWRDTCPAPILFVPITLPRYPSLGPSWSMSIIRPMIKTLI